MKASTISALRQWAERPDAGPEGIVARELLARHGSTPPTDARPTWDDRRLAMEAKAAEYERGEITQDELLEFMRWQNQQPLPNTWQCACGRMNPISRGVISTSQCSNNSEHERIRDEIRSRFKKGDRVYYNYHAYDPNCPGVVTGYVRPKPDNWGWLCVKMDYLKNSRAIPIKTPNGWALTHEPILKEEFACQRVTLAEHVAAGSVSCAEKE